MADGFNNARALRVTELLRDYQSIQDKIAAYNAMPPEAAHNELGFVTLRQCHAEARALLNAPYPVELLHPPTAPGDAEKRQLQRVILDASARRFQAQKVYLRATAAMKWINRRKQIVPNGKKPTNGQLTQLQQAETAMRAMLQEIVNATDQRIITALRTKDQQAGYWLNDDPGLSEVLNWIRNHH